MQFKTNLWLITSLLIFISVILLPDRQIHAQKTPHEAAAQMGRGINLGNTLDAIPTEGSWYPSLAQEYYFAAYKAAGFDNVRIPVTWANHFEPGNDYQIRETWMNRVEQIVDWALEADLFVTLNAHHDSWIKEHYTEENKAKFDSLWTQIAFRFKDKSEKLLFEILNEPEVMTMAQLNDLQPRILSIIREHNPTRIVLFSGTGYNASNNLININIPDPDDEYLMGFFHAYDPWNFISGQEPWPGTPSQIQSLRSNMERVKNWSIEHNIPVILNEWGATHKVNYNQKMRYLGIYNNIILEYYPYSYWDDGGDFRLYEREDNKWDDVKDVLMYFSDYSPDPFTLQIADEKVTLNWTNRLNTDSMAIDSTVIQRKMEYKGDFLYHDVIYEGNNYTDTSGIITGNTYYYRIVQYLASGDSLYSYPQQIYAICSERFNYNNMTLTVPGTIEAEHFDVGCQHLTYYDTTPENIPNDFRQDEPVDIQARSGGGYHVGYVAQGEWLEYTVNVEQSAMYYVSTHVATTQTGGKMSIQFNGGTKLHADIPNTGSWETTTTVVNRGYLGAGVRTIRINIEGTAAFNIDKMVLSIDDPNSINTLKPEEIQLYPNPAKNSITLKIPSGLQVNKVTIYDSQGRIMELYENAGSERSFDTSSFPDGYYILHFSTTNNENYQVPFVKSGN